MLMITGQKPVKSSKQGQFQIVDVVDMMGPLTKFTHQIVSSDNIPSKVREAFRLAEEERPGATHLELPEDIADEDSNTALVNISTHRRPIAEEKGVRHAVEMIEKSIQPLILVGAGANRKLPSKMLTEFVAKTGIPFVTTQMGKGVIDETSELFLGNTTLSDGDFVHRAINAADLIINVGHDVVEKPPFFMHELSKVIHVNFNSAQVDPVYFPQVEVLGDIANSIWQMKERITAQQHWNFNYFMEVKSHMDAHILEGADDDRWPVYPQRLVADVRAAMPDDGIIALDNGVYKIWFARNYRAKKPNTVLLDNALATMGAGLPSAMAAHLVSPNKAVTAICGDGGFMMNSQEMETAVRLNMHLTIIILRDDAYGMIKWKQANMNFDNYGLDYGNPDFVKYAESYGAKGYRIEKTEDLLPLLKACQAEHGVHLIDVPVDYSENDRILNDEIRELSKRI